MGIINSQLYEIFIHFPFIGHRFHFRCFISEHSLSKSPWPLPVLTSFRIPSWMRPLPTRHSKRYWMFLASSHPLGPQMASKVSIWASVTIPRLCQMLTTLIVNSSQLGKLLTLLAALMGVTIRIKNRLLHLRGSM